MTLADATAAAIALDALPGPAPSCAARALADVLRRQGRHDLARVVDEWLARPGG